MLPFQQIYNEFIQTIGPLKLFGLEIRSKLVVTGQGQSIVEPKTPFACQMCVDKRMNLLRKN